MLFNTTTDYLFFNPEEAEECFIDYFMADKPEKPATTEFCDYLIDNYIIY